MRNLSQSYGASPAI